MRKSSEGKSIWKWLLLGGIVAVGLVFVSILGFIGIRGFVQDRESGIAAEQGRNVSQAAQEQQAALRTYYDDRFVRLQKLQKKRAKYYKKPDKSQRNLSVAAILVDDDGDGVPEIVVDQPALQYERKKHDMTEVSYDGMYMGNVQLGIYTRGKMWAVPQKPRKKTRKQRFDISPTVYVSKDRSRISVVIRTGGTGGDEGQCDGYLYEVTDKGVKEISRKTKVRERELSDTTTGSYKSTRAYRKFKKKYILKDADVFREDLSYDQEGNMKGFSSLKAYREYLAEHGIRLDSK